MDWHLLPQSDLLRTLNTTESGIDIDAAPRLIEEHGLNQLVEKKKKTIWVMLLHQLLDFMILILVAAAIISGILGDLKDTIVILAIIVINTVVGVIQEYRAEKAIDALKKLATGNSRVIRSGKSIEIPVSQLVPGDLIVLEAGNLIPADIRFSETHEVKVDESALTGESNNVEKIRTDLKEGDYPLGDRINMGFKGTHITSGRAQAYVVDTGMKTELGKIASMIQTDETSTPLQKRLSDFGKRLSVGILIICVVIFSVGLLRGENLITMLLTSISLAVAAIPEALPALVTIALAFGAKRLVKSNALIRKLPAVETLGSVTFICTDKTGTLTLNKMTVEEIFEFKTDESKSPFGEYNPLLASIALNNDVTSDEEGKLTGESTETALAQFAIDNKYNRDKLEGKFKRLAELPFNSDRKCMTTIHQIENGVIAITKGAIDVLTEKLNDKQQSIINEIDDKQNELAAKGFRVLGFAFKVLPSLPEKLIPDEIESSLTLIGVTGLIDPPREEVKKAVSQCKEAGIIPVMITGDHSLTAKFIAEKLGILTSKDDLILSGSELAKLSLEDFEKIVEKVKVYARVNPEQKLKIITALKSKNHFVAMTGDGVNDAPALKNADIGIAMGKGGTEVAKEASHMILLDDNFSTIVVAVKHGRRIFDNILKFIKYILTGNSGEIWAIFLAPFLGLPIPLIPIQILWINLVSDGLPGLALAAEPAAKDIMKRHPRPPKENIFSGGMGVHILWVGFLIGVLTLATQAWSINQNNSHWQTMAFTVLGFCQLWHVIAIRSDRESLFTIGLLSNKPMLGAILLTVGLQVMIIYVPFFNDIFLTQPLTFTEMMATIVVSGLVFIAVEIEKWVKRKKTALV